jgi:hypothetical protein
MSKASDEIVQAVLPDLTKRMTVRAAPHVGGGAAQFPSVGGVTLDSGVLGNILKKAIPLVLKWVLGKYGPALKAIVERSRDNVQVFVDDSEIEALRELLQLLKDGK